MTEKNNPGTIDFIETMNNLFRRWWLIAVFTIVGGLLALAFSALKPPKYEAEAIFSASIDYRDINFENLVDETESPLTFSQYDIDMALSAVHTVLLQVRDEAFTFAQSLDPSLEAETFENNMLIERQLGLWYLRYRHEDAQTAQSIVNYWAELGIDVMKAGQAAETIEPYVLVELTSEASLPQSPVYQNRNTLALAGIVAGFALGILVVDIQYRFIPRKEQVA
jgi:capsular polysaccharide biosynthesis protein